MHLQIVPHVENDHKFLEHATRTNLRFRNRMFFFQFCMVHGPCKAIWASLDQTRSFFWVQAIQIATRETSATKTAKRAQISGNGRKLKNVSLVILGRSIFHVHGNLMEFGSLGHRTWQLFSSSLAMNKAQKLEHF